MRLSQCVVLAVDLAALAYAQFPSLPTDLTVISSKLQPDVIISYKQVRVARASDMVCLTEFAESYLRTRQSVVGIRPSSVQGAG